MTPHLGTWETGNAALTDKGRRGQREADWEIRDELHHRQAVCGCSDIAGSAVQHTI